MRREACGPSMRPDEHGSRTLTVQRSDANGAATSGRDVGVLHLRAPERSDPGSSAGNSDSARRVMWTDDTVDNEGLGRKKSKICCIYHKPKAFDESSSESSSCESSDSSDVPESSEDENRAKPSRAKQTCSNHSCSSSDASHRRARKRVNAYERA